MRNTIGVCGLFDGNGGVRNCGGAGWYGSGAQDVPLGYAGFLMATVVCGRRRGACV